MNYLKQISELRTELERVKGENKVLKQLIEEAKKVLQVDEFGFYVRDKPSDNGKNLNEDGSPF